MKLAERVKTVVSLRTILLCAGVAGAIVVSLAVTCAFTSRKVPSVRSVVKVGNLGELSRFPIPATYERDGGFHFEFPRRIRYSDTDVMAAWRKPFDPSYLEKLQAETLRLTEELLDVAP